jgi:hypothetical protein
LPEILTEKKIAWSARRSYNNGVPTPFYHLSIAESLSKHPALPGPVQRLLENYPGPFLLGNTAPDVQVISGQERQATHFFRFPIQIDSQSPWEAMLALHTSLAQPRLLPDAQAAFIAGYLCHLQADWMWICEIYLPAFGPTHTWGTFHNRLYLHNVLRAYLDAGVLPSLSQATPQHLENSQPDHWLPFVKDGHLKAWRDYLARQLAPGAMIETIEVFAARQGISPIEFKNFLDSEERMEKEIFIHLPRGVLSAYHERAIEAGIQLLTTYLGQSQIQSIPKDAKTSRQPNILQGGGR